MLAWIALLAFAVAFVLGSLLRLAS